MTLPWAAPPWAGPSPGATPAAVPDREAPSPTRTRPHDPRYAVPPFADAVAFPLPRAYPRPLQTVTAEEVRWYRALLGLPTPDDPEARVPTPLLVGLLWAALRDDILDVPARVASLDTLVLGPLAPEEPFVIETEVEGRSDRQARVRLSVRAGRRLVLRGHAVLHLPGTIPPDPP